MGDPSADLNAMSPEDRSSWFHSEADNTFDDDIALFAQLKAADERAGELRALRKLVERVPVLNLSFKGHDSVMGEIDRRISELEGEATT